MTTTRVDTTDGSVAVVGAPGPAPGAPPRRERDPRRSQGRTWIVLVGDALALVAALVATYAVADAIAPPAVIAPAGFVVVAGLLAPVVWLAVLAVYRLYEGQSRAIAPATFDDVGDLFHALIAGSLGFLMLNQATARVAGVRFASPLEAMIFVPTALVLLLVARGCVRTWLLPSVVQPRRALVVGAGPVGLQVRRKIVAHPEYGLELVGFVDDDPAEPRPVWVKGRTDELARVVDEQQIDWVIVAFTETPYEAMLDQMRAVRRPDVHLSIVPRFFELFASNATLEDLEGIPVVSLPPMRFSRSVRLMKRATDVVVSAVGLLVLSPLLAACAVAIRLDSPGPVLFRQPRNGRGGCVFSIVKFRTMREGAEAERFALAERNQVDGPLFKIHDDPRVTRVGRVLRRTSIDELPQLWNVLRGDMSLVGPRPFVVHEASQITGWASRRLDIAPGITGLWQVLGRNDIPFEEMVKLDYIYVTSWSPWWDLKILLQTIPVVLARRGAY